MTSTVTSSSDFHDADGTRLWALVPCAGVGSRAVRGQDATLPKQYQKVAGLPLVAHTVRALAQVERLHRMLIVIAPDDDDGESALAGQVADAMMHIARCGGATRADSVLNGLDELIALGASEDDWVLVHDAARCLVQPYQVDQLIDACLGDAVGGLLALPLPDTLKQANQNAPTGQPRVQSTLPRADKWLAQTPQMFRLGLLKRALREAPGLGASVTDEASAIEALGLEPRLVEGSAQNFKVTYPADFELAEAMLGWRTRTTSTGSNTGVPT